MTTSLVPQTELTKNAGSEFSTEGNLPVMESQLMSIDMQNAAFIMESLTNLYSDPYLSVAREYIANAIDSHIEAGNTDPVEVTTPNYWTPNLVIKDQGVGMSLDDVFRYGTYGSSDKRDNLEVVGNFGMGSKSALAVTNSFTISAVKDGTYTLATIGRNDDGHGQVDIIATDPTTDPNGVTITIPITAGNVYQVQRKVSSVIEYLPEGVVEVDGVINTDTRKNLTKISDDSHIGSFSWGTSYLGMTDVYIISGGFGYKVPFTFMTDLDDEFKDDLVGVPKDIYIDVPTGSVDLTPSREQLRMTARTKSLVTESVYAVLKETSSTYTEQLNRVTTFEEVFELISDTGSVNSTNKIIRLCENLEIPGMDNPVVHYYRNGEGFHSARNTSRLGESLARDIALSEDSLPILLEMDKDYSDNSLTTRVKSFLNKVTEKYTKFTPVLVLNSEFKDDPNNTNDNLYRYIERKAVRMKATELYAAVNEYNKNNRTSTPSTGYSLGKGDDAEIESQHIQGNGLSVSMITYPAAGEMKKYYEDMGSGDRDTIYVLNKTKSSGNAVTARDISYILALRKLYDEDYVVPDVVLIFGGTRKENYFVQRGMNAIPLNDFYTSHKSALTSEKTLSKVKDLYEYLSKTEGNFVLDDAVRSLTVTHPATKPKVEEIKSLLFSDIPEGSELLLGITNRSYSILTILRTVIREIGDNEALSKTINSIREASYKRIDNNDINMVHSLLKSSMVLLTAGHTAEGYGMLDTLVDILTKEED